MNMHTYLHTYKPVEFCAHEQGQSNVAGLCGICIIYNFAMYIYIYKYVHTFTYIQTCRTSCERAGPIQCRGILLYIYNI